MHASKEKATRSVKKKKNHFINVIGDKFAMSIRWGKLDFILQGRLRLLLRSVTAFGCTKIGIQNLIDN